MKKKGIVNFLDKFKEKIIKEISSFVSLPKITVLILGLMGLMLLYDFSGSQTWANTFKGIKDRLPFTITTKEYEQNYKCFVNGRKYKVSKEVCDDIRENITADQEANVKTPTPTPTTKIKNNVSYPTSTPDPDPIVACNVHADCGGGSRQLRKSICEQSVCCQIGGSWIFYESDSKCIQDQQSNNNQGQNTTTNNTTSKIPVYLASSNSTRYCKPEGVNAIQSADQAIAQKNRDFETCLSDSNKNFKDCIDKCTNNSIFDICSNSCNITFGAATCKISNDYSALNNLLTLYCN